MKSPNLWNPADIPDAKYISVVSTILVATIQEAKDRISQIEYIFCSQLFPRFPINSESLQKIYHEAREAAEGTYKQKEKELLLQIEKLQHLKDHVLEENQSLKLEKAKFTDMDIQSRNHLEELQKELKQQTMEANEGREAHQNLQKLLETKSSLLHSYEMTIRELEERKAAHVQELMKKSKEVDGAMELQNKLLQMNETTSTMIAQKDVQLKEYEEKTNGLVSKLENMENKVNELLLELKCKVEEVDKGKELQSNMLKKIESQSLELMNNEQLLSKYKKDNWLLASEVERLVNRADSIQKELEKKSIELEEVCKVKVQLLEQSDSFNVERIKRGKVLEELMEERKQLLDKQRGLENEVNKLQNCLSERTVESCEGEELHAKLLQQIEVKDSELLAEKNKKRDVITAYKKLKSQYNYLLKKYALTSEAAVPLEKMKDETETIGCNQNLVGSHVVEKNKTSGITGDVTKRLDEQQLPEDGKGHTFVQRSGLASPSTSNNIIAPKGTNIKSCPATGAKRPISYWRDTRSHQSHAGPDPHDNFLDTPLENVRQTLGNAVKEDGDDMNVDAGLQNQHMSPPKTEKSGFKYVGPVRRKSERENLKGMECKQCKKFYDAVLPGSVGGDKQNVRCEHHDGVSRHRGRIFFVFEGILCGGIRGPEVIVDRDFMEEELGQKLENVSIAEAGNLVIDIEPKDVSISAEECSCSLFEWTKGLSSSHEKFGELLIWVQVYGVPINWLSTEVGLNLERAYKGIRNVNLACVGNGGGRIIRIQVVLDMNQPLPRWSFIRLGQYDDWLRAPEGYAPTGSPLASNNSEPSYSEKQSVENFIKNPQSTSSGMRKVDQVQRASAGQQKGESSHYPQG
ncbi:Protein gamma response 1 [Striga hermonthica]|uniref:Protein gamma response 1 n=1 Tax=Striga hermonthica TaxID=68872 RepID=A0A9N7MJ95_STRHE|nr:Protein gamma response 1 [Striga hermonthica]